MFGDSDNYPQSLTKAGMVFLVFVAIVLIAFFTIYPLMTALFDAFDAADFGNAEDEKDTYLPTIRVACTAFFAILIALPATWFIFWVFSREPNVEN